MPVAVPGAPPEFPQCDPLSPSSVTVSWKPPPVEQSNGLILGYTLTYRLENKIGGELTLHCEGASGISLGCNWKSASLRPVCLYFVWK